MFQSESSTILVYQSEYAGSNQATALTWVVGNDLEKEAAALKAKGVVFGRYELSGTTRKGDVHHSDGLRAAWFMDADGNILVAAVCASLLVVLAIVAAVTLRRVRAHAELERQADPVAMAVR